LIIEQAALAAFFVRLFAETKSKQVVEPGCLKRVKKLKVFMAQCRFKYETAEHKKKETLWMATDLSFY